MKLLCLSDCHLSSNNPIGRKDDVLETSLRKMNYVLECAKKEKAVIIQAADFLDSSRSWILHSRLIDLFEKYKEIEIFTIYGQHDMYMHSDESKPATSLGVLIKTGYIHELDSMPININRDIHLYGCSFGEEVPIPKYNNVDNILVIHSPIASVPLFKSQQYIPAMSFLKSHEKYKLILCGDIHQKFFFEYKGRYILNTGSMMRLEATKYNFTHKPCFAIFDTVKDEVSWIEIPCSPVDEILSRKHIEDKDRSNDMLNEFVKTIKNTEFKGIDFHQNLNQYFLENKIRKEVRQAIREVARGEVK